MMTKTHTDRHSDQTFDWEFDNMAYLFEVI
jgi:hypothetical protein